MHSFSSVPCFMLLSLNNNKHNKLQPSDCHPGIVVLLQQHARATACRLHLHPLIRRQRVQKGSSHVIYSCSSSAAGNRTSASANMIPCMAATHTVYAVSQNRNATVSGRGLRSKLPAKGFFFLLQFAWHSMLTFGSGVDVAQSGCRHRFLNNISVMFCNESRFHGTAVSHSLSAERLEEAAAQT
jgi:hypothetical protein